MGVLKRLTFYLGFVLGLLTVAAAGAVALTYLFTGKLISIRSDEQGTRIVLDTPDTLVALLRRQMGKARSTAPFIELK